MSRTSPRGCPGLGLILALIPGLIPGLRLALGPAVSLGLSLCVLLRITGRAHHDLENNLIIENGDAAIGFGGAWIAGGSTNSCTWRYSDLGPLPVAGPGNLAVDPRFADLVDGDCHLQASSPRRDAGDSMATQVVDLDGDSRPQGAAPDLGADEIN